MVSQPRPGVRYSKQCCVTYLAKAMSSQYDAPLWGGIVEGVAKGWSAPVGTMYRYLDLKSVISFYLIYSYFKSR